MEVVGVLRDEELELSEPLELGEREVGGVGADPAREDAPPRGRQAGVSPRPHALGAAEVGDAGVGADARPREGDDALALDNPPSDSLDLLVGQPHLGNPFPILGLSGFSSQTFYKAPRTPWNAPVACIAQPPKTNDT